jgi:predicted aldo/keto reductase-like oxidoreductase
MEKKSNGQSRRRFLKRSAYGLGGLAMLPSVLGKDSFAQAGEPAKAPKIIKRKFGKTGLELPIVSFGVMSAENPDLVREALDAGIVHLDTAHAYQRGRNEEMIGEVVKDVTRDSFVVSTKVIGDGMDRKTGLFTEESKPGPFMEKFETSLKRLGLDHVDILYLHSVTKREAVLYEPFLEVMQKIKEQGKARFIGVSSHRDEPEVIRAAIEGEVHDVVLVAYNFRQPHAREVEKAMKEASDAGLGVVAMKTQAGVYWDQERQTPINMKAALKWALRKEYVHTSIPGITTFDQLKLDVSVMEDLALTAEEEKDLELGMETGMNGLFCDQCGQCVAQCRKHLDVPTMMRSYMYAHGYRNLGVAKETFEVTGLNAEPCEDCDACSVHCTMGFDVREKIENIARIRNVPDDFVA